MGTAIIQESIRSSNEEQIQLRAAQKHAINVLKTSTSCHTAEWKKKKKKQHIRKSQY